MYLAISLSFLAVEGDEDPGEVSADQSSKLKNVGNLAAQITGGGGINGVVSALVDALLDLVEVLCLVLFVICLFFLVDFYTHSIIPWQTSYCCRS